MKFNIKNVRAAIRKVKKYTQAAQNRFRVKRIPIARILRSGENGIPANQYSRLTGNPLRSSMLSIDGPHLQLLKAYDDHRERIFDPEFFSKTPYYSNAAECIEYTGRYFSAHKNEEIAKIANAYIRFVFHGETETLSYSSGHSPPHTPITVRPIANSQHYELVDGNHRLAFAHFKGAAWIDALVSPHLVSTVAQDYLLDVLWQNGKIELYQPIDLPEVSTWSLVRNCEDRFGMISSFLSSNSIGNSLKSALDLGCSYGWFGYNAQTRLGLNSTFVDRDPFALNVAHQIYGVPREKLIRSPIQSFLNSTSRKFDVTFFLSVLHHFIRLGDQSTALEIIRKVDQITDKVLFFEMGQGTEKWFEGKMRMWTPEYIRKWIYENTSFSNVTVLGTDVDCKTSPGNYGRTFFVCHR